VHKESGNLKTSLLLTKSVIPVTYESPAPGRLRDTILTVMGRNEDYSHRGEPG